MNALYKVAIMLSVFSALILAGEGKHLFILSGQSNMERLKPEEAFIPAVTKAFGADNVIVVKDAHGGQPIRNWYKEWKPSEGKELPKGTFGNDYDKLMSKVKAAIGSNKIQTVTFMWMQGERDAREGHGDVYAASYKGLMAQLEADLNRKDINHVIGRLSDYGNNQNSYPDWNLVRKVQVELAEQNPNIEWIDTDDCNGGKNDLHMTKDGYVKMGERFAEKAIAFVNKQIKQ